MICPFGKTQDLIVVKGYVYIDDVKTQPDQVIIIFSGKQFPATTYNDASYLVSIYGVPIGIIGTFNVVYHGNTYFPDETFITEVNVETYNINLHIDTSSGPQPPPIDPTNIQPKAVAGGPYYGQVFDEINFDGSDSYDTDGTISEYVWDFGDGTIKSDVLQTHTYEKINTFRVSLTVTDNKGKKDLDITYAYITELPNTPPGKPVINGIKSGTTKYQYNYTFFSTDKENDKIRYLIDWGDEINPTASHFIQNGTIYTINHSWDYPGIYVLRAYGIDDKEAISQESEQVVLIDTIYCGDIGYMTDYTEDSVYDLFYSNNTGEETLVEQSDELYLIDTDNDGNYDHEFNLSTLQVSNYVETNINKETSSLIDLIAPFVIYILIFILIFLFSFIGFLVYKIRKKPKKEKGKEIKDKEKKIKEEQHKKFETKKVNEKPKEKVIRIEDEIDELLAKKKK